RRRGAHDVLRRPVLACRDRGRRVADRRGNSLRPGSRTAASRDGCDEAACVSEDMDMQWVVLVVVVPLVLIPIVLLYGFAGCAKFSSAPEPPSTTPAGPPAAPTDLSATPTSTTDSAHTPVADGL